MRVSYGRNYHYYACTKKINSKGISCDNKNVKGPDIEKVVVGSILDIDTDMLLENFNKDELGVVSREKDMLDIQNKIKAKKLQLNSLFDRMADFDDDLADLFKDRINELGKEIKELNAKYNDLANDIDSSKNDFKSVSLVVDAIKEFKTYYDCVDDLQKKKFMLGVIIDKIRWNGDTDKVDIEFWGSKKK